MKESPAPHNRFYAILLAALSPSVITIALLMFGSGSKDPTTTSFYIFSLEIILPIAILFFGRHVEPLKLNAVGYALLSPCVLAPLALLYPWATVPGNLPGIGWGGFSFFLGWLTKYPSFGPFNLEVLLGMVCVIACAIIPVVFAISNLHGTAGKKWIDLTLVGLCVIFYIPLLIRLDLALWIAGLSGYSIYTPVPGLCCGPAMRIIALIAMLFTSLRRRSDLPRVTPFQHIS